MDSLLTALSDALNSSFALALVASFAWGVSSVLLSPCHLSSIPLIIGFLAARGEKKVFHGALLSLLFAVGILLSIAAIGAITAALGRMMGDVGPLGTYGIAAVFFIVGLVLMDIVRLPDSGVSVRPLATRSTVLSATALGLIIGIALGPCTFAFMAPVLSVVFQMSNTSVSEAALLLLSFGLGHCLVIVLAGGLASRVQAYLDWTNRTQAIVWMKRGAGFLVLLGGVYTLATA